MSTNQNSPGCFGCIASVALCAMLFVVLGLVLKLVVIAFMAGWGAL
ncbi:hypothetical protein [Mesoterricola sediminis]|uniref:Uncharacterized protein n=1 Tax=Mesoterricola sediminis TaxID=2927980 RepID=A0AA48GRH8_9BACT|nr:hypothetical protein [Mesoterricola sediminis]BDU76242.1 hypothetical protein METESE_12000 [Mesoterricola sediminis]